MNAECRADSADDKMAAGQKLHKTARGPPPSAPDIGRATPAYSRTVRISTLSHLRLNDGRD